MTVDIDQDPRTNRLIREAQRDVVHFAQRMARDGLIVARSGNVSARVGGYIITTPSGVDYATLTEADTPIVKRATGESIGPLRPTSELPLHTALYAMADSHSSTEDVEPVNAVVHTHSPYATALSTLVERVPPIHYITAICGGIIRVARYATYGTPELAENARDAMRGRTAALLANHGVVAVGGTLAAAYERAEQIEWLSKVYLIASAAGEPRVLDERQLSDVREKFRGYGQKEG